MRILGQTTHHDASVCLLEDGNVLRFYKEERLNGVKRESPCILGLYKIYEEFGDTMDYIVGEADDPCVPEICKRLFPSAEVIDVKKYHHLCHASLAFYSSGFKEALTVVIDRNGSVTEEGTESETVFCCRYPNTFTTVYKNLSNQIDEKYNITAVYESATALIDQHPLESGKTMGLASYGRNKLAPSLFEDGIPIKEKFTTVHKDYMWGSIPGKHHTVVNRELHSRTTSDLNEDNYHIYADYAYQVQSETQQAVGDIIEKFDHLNIKNVCITGGYGLNVVANQYLTERFPWYNFFFEPLADDTGNSIGAALYLHHELTKSQDPFDFKNTMFHGKEYPIPKEYKTCELDFIVDSICNNKSVAVFHKQAEAGPRALGNRSILFNPWNPDAKEIVNKIKKREWYRPFAAMVLDYEAPYLFNMGMHEVNDINCKYMTRSVTVRDPFLYGITHIDQTCRIQTIDYKHHLYRLLRSISSRIGYGVLLNTSFNLAGKPLVETLADAEKTFYNSDLDILWFPETKQFISKD